MSKLMRYLICVITILSAVMLCACEKEKKQVQADYHLYYVKSDMNGILPEPYNTDKANQNDIVEDFLEKLQKNSVKDGIVPAIPKEVTVKGYSVKQGVLTVNFSKQYYDIKAEKESLCRAAIVLTLVQIKHIESISFTVKGKPLKIDGEIVGAMNSNDFSSDLSGRNGEFVTDNFKIYFTNGSGTKLKEYNLKDANYAGMSKEEFVVRELIKGPDKEEYTETLSPDVYVNSVTTVDNICYVDFDENFLTEQSPVSNKLVIYSIVNSILELTDINKVQISVNGDSNISYRNDISLKNAFIRNLDLVEQ